MNKLTLDEAIKHCLEVAGKYETQTEEWCKECAADHRQLAEWLTELKELKIENEELKRCLIQANNRIPPFRLIT